MSHSLDERNPERRQLARLEDDGFSVMVKFPDMWVIAKR